MRNFAIGVIVAAALLPGGFAAAQQPSPTAAPPAPPPYRGFVAKDMHPDTRLIVPPPRGADDRRDNRDRHVFRTTRKIEGSERWELAKRDIPYSIAAMLKNFSCAAAIDLTPENAPKLADLLTRVGADAVVQLNLAKDHFKRKRPYFVDEGQVCAPRTASLDGSFDYPSGHTSWGWTIGLILAELLPDHTTEILMRARSFGESRVICGVHNASAIEAGRTLGSIVVARLHGSAEFRAALEQVRMEVNALAKAEPKSSCSMQAELIRKTPY